jgi:cytochrome P450
MQQLSPAVEKPAHVPAERVVDFDVFSFPIENAEYQLALKRLNAAGVPEIFWTPRNGGHWVVTRATDIDLLLKDPARFSSRTISVPKVEGGMPPMKPIQLDPPEHVKYRVLLASALSPKAVNTLAEDARKLSIELIDGFYRRGECEFISEFAQHLPIAIFMKIVDLPESDRVLLTEIAEAVMRGENEQVRFAALQRLAGYGMQKVSERRANPGTDLISTIAAAKVDGKPLDEASLTGMMILLLLAGLDTVASMLGFFALFLAHNPGHRQQLIDDPSLIPNAVEELLRRFGIVIIGREVVADTEFHGVKLQPGEMVIAPTALSGLDERKTNDPLTVDFHREKPVHNAFGGGVHRCMGAMLARAELRIFLEEWLPRIPQFEVKPGADIEVSARSVATVTHLPLVWKVD